VLSTTYNRTDAAHPGDVTSIVDPNNNTWIYTYDANGYRNSVKDPLRNLTAYVYNGKGWMRSSVAPNGNVSRKDMGGHGIKAPSRARLTSAWLIDPNGIRTPAARRHCSRTKWERK
jgi:YD repeat-containing protein